MRTGKLTAVKVAAIVRKAKPGYSGDGGGLYLSISKYGTPSWAFRYRIDGRLREAGLGSLDTWSLAEARERAREFRQQRAAGLDPIDRRRAERARAGIEAARVMTFRQCAEAYIGSHEAGWRNPKHRAQWPATLMAYVYPAFGALPVAAIDTALVMKAVEPIWTKKPETASRVRGRIESVLDWAAARGYRQGDNPARWRGHLDNLLPKRSLTVSREPSLAEIMTRLHAGAEAGPWTEEKSHRQRLRTKLRDMDNIEISRYPDLAELARAVGNPRLEGFDGKIITENEAAAILDRVTERILKPLLSGALECIDKITTDDKRRIIYAFLGRKLGTKSG